MPKVSVVKPKKPMKPAGGLKNAHTANTQHGMGNYTGGSVKNPMGKMREGGGSISSKLKKVGTPPKSLA